MAARAVRIWDFTWEDSRSSIRNSFADRELPSLIGLTSLRSNGIPFVAPKLNHRRAVFVLAKIDEILAWEQRSEQERDTRFVELGRYLCEVRAGQYWRVDNLKSFDEFLEKKSPESRRKAYYLMGIHEQLPRQIHRDLKEIGWTKATDLAKVAHREGQRFDCGNRFVDAGWAEIPRVLPRDDLCRLFGGSEFRGSRSRYPVALDSSVLRASAGRRETRAPRGHPGMCVSSIRQRRPRVRLEPDSYRALHRKVLERDGWKCQHCGRATELEVHHIRFRSALGHDEPDNLITLCSECHRDVHYSLRR
jgi:hypothetical protein